ncbi:MAG: exopolysaccharide production repressor exox [Rhizobiaceae bacterium]|nr:exopolysaccharide production repressor exox [Rhizobiaceae bacterium]
MTFPKFLIGMLAVICIVAVWSYLDSASVGIIALRIVACAVILQVGYFLIVLAMVRAAPKPTAERNNGAGSQAPVPKDADSLTTHRTSG